MNQLLWWFSARLPGRIISEGAIPYLERYYLFTLFGWRWYLHRFVGSDPDRGLHDHPWRWAFSIILWGWYWEHTRSGVRKVRWLNFLLGDSFHRVVLPTREDGALKPCWTIFVHKVGDIKPWGFMRQFANTIGTQVWTEFQYPGGAKKADWWLTAPKGRDLPFRAPLTT